MADNNVTFKIVEHIGKLRPTSDTGWARELNKVCGNGGKEKFDIREGDSSHQRMSKGITLTDAEMQTICEPLADRF